MYTVWHVDKYKITFKLVINSRRTSCGLVPGRGLAVEKHWYIQSKVLLKMGESVAQKNVQQIQIGQ